MTNKHIVMKMDVKMSGNVSKNSKYLEFGKSKTDHYVQGQHRRDFNISTFLLICFLVIALVLNYF